MLNRPSNINEDVIDIRPQIECNVLLDEYPTVKETRKAVQQLVLVQMQFFTEVNKAGGYPLETDRVVSLYVEEGGYQTSI